MCRKQQWNHDFLTLPNPIVKGFSSYTQHHFFYTQHFEWKTNFVPPSLTLKCEIQILNLFLLSHHSRLHHFLLLVLSSEILSSSFLQSMLDLHQSVYGCCCVRHRHAITNDDNTRIDEDEPWIDEDNHKLKRRR